MDTHVDKYARYEKVDVMGYLTNLEALVHKKRPYEHETAAERLIVIKELSEQVRDFITNYLNNSHTANLVQREKKDKLLLAQSRIRDIIELSYWGQQHNNNFQQEEHINLYDSIKKYFDEYASTGSIYLFRHCEKQKRKMIYVDEQGKHEFPYDGIPNHAIREQAMRRSEQLLEEVLMSPKPVHVYFYWSEFPRTRIFAQIIQHILKRANHFTQHKKVHFHVKGQTKELGYTYRFTEEALGHCVHLAKEFGGEEEFIKKWLVQDNKFKQYDDIPKPSVIQKDFNDFLIDGNRKIHKHADDQYRMIVAVSHSWIIDALIVYYIHDMFSHVDHIIKTATFVKVEHNQFCYMGNWRGLKEGIFH